MKKNFGKFLTVGLLSTVLLVGSQMCYASRNIGNYTGKVPTVNDLESTSLVKTNNSDAVNSCDSMGDGTLVSWIESNSGSNITSKVSYSKPGRRAMGYSNAAAYIKDKVHLNISTSIGTWHTIDTSGTWSPDYK